MQPKEEDNQDIRYLNAKKFIVEHINNNEDYIKDIVSGFGFYYPWFKKAMNSNSTNQRDKYRNFVIDFAENNLNGALFTVLKHVSGGSVKDMSYTDICGVYRYFRFYPDGSKKFVPAPGVLVIDIVDGTPMFFHNSNNSNISDLKILDIDGIKFYYEHRGSVIIHGRNIFCVGSRDSVIRSMIFQLPNYNNFNNIPIVLKKNVINGLVLSVLTANENPFAAITSMYHESFDGVLPTTAGAILVDSQALTWVWGFMFGNIKDAPSKGEGDIDNEPKSQEEIKWSEQNRIFLKASTTRIRSRKFVKNWAAPKKRKPKKKSTEATGETDNNKPGQ